MSAFAENTHSLSPRLQLDLIQTPVSTGQQVSLYFAWHTYGSIIKSKTIFPTNPDLVNKFHADPSQYPLIEKVFNQANQVLDINFYDYIQGDLASKPKTNVLLAHILFCYGFAEQWQSTFKGSIKNITFTSGGVFAALLFEGVITLDDALPFIRDFYDYLWPLAKEVAEGKNNVYSAVLKADSNEDIFNLIRTIILLNSELENVFIKEMRWYNQVIVSGNKEQVDIVVDIFTRGINSRFAQQYFIPLDVFGDPIPEDTRHYVSHSYKDLAVHIPLVAAPSWLESRLKNFKLAKPKHGIIGAEFERLNEISPLNIYKFIQSACFSTINTVGTFEDLRHRSEIILAIGTPEWFLNEIPEIKNKTMILTSPEQTMSFSASTNNPKKPLHLKERTAPVPDKKIEFHKLIQNSEKLIAIGI